MTNTIPRNLITYESVDQLARTLAVSATYHNHTFPDLTGDAAIMGDMLLAKVNPDRGIPYLKSKAPIAVVDTDLESWFFWACGGSKHWGSYAHEVGPSWHGFVTFMIFDTRTTSTHSYLVSQGYQETIPLAYDDRCKMLDLLYNFNLLPVFTDPCLPDSFPTV